MGRIFFVIFFIGACATLSSAECPSRYVEAKVWEEVLPYLMPQDHPIKRRLDKIVNDSATSVFANMQAMCAAGFEKVIPQHKTKVIVTRHPKMKGYIIKAYLDDQDYYEGRPEHYYWVKRVEGANLIRGAIKEYGYERLLKVPRKWIYLLPDKPSTIPQGKARKMFILVEDEMDILSNRQNEKRWGSSAATKELLKALHKVITKFRFKDCAKPANCPFCKDGKVALVDTQSFYKKKVGYYKLTPYLKPKMKSYWRKLSQPK